MEQSHEALLGEVLNRIEQNNESLRAGTPLAELRDAIEAALQSLPELQTDDFDQVMGNSDFLGRLVAEAPEIIGWNADQIITWIEQIAKQANS